MHVVRSGGGWLRRRADLAVLVLLAYLPALASSPGRMPADSKLYLYQNPGALLSDARWSYDTHQFGGWVTHQIVSYLWPAGPWFWTFERLGVPDWVAHRLWIATIMVAAGLGMRWLARELGLVGGAALVAAAAYQCTPYLLPYVSRTSVMLLPWAGLPWLVALTRRAVRRGGWRDPAWCGLIVLTVGGINLTATAMIIPGPVLWLLHEGVGRTVPWRRVMATVGRIGVLTGGASVWWLAAVSVQGKYGADVLTYSETYRDVTHTASAAEALRGQGYWLGYVNAPVRATTMTSVYQHSPGLILLGFGLAAASLAGLAAVRWGGRRFAAWMVLAGVVLASMGYLGDRASPLARFLNHYSASSVVLGLRSSTRAVPLAVLGLALGLGALVQVLPFRLPPARSWVVPGVALVLVVANMPALWTAGLVDPANDRDEHPPAAWVALGKELDAEGGGRVLQLPGAEFGAHTWGVTVDPILPGLTRREVLTRDLLPLGSPGLMDTLYALDDTIQAGTFDPATLAPVARLLGADTLVVPLDWDTDRYGTYPAEQFASMVAGAPGVHEVERAPGYWVRYSIDGTGAPLRAGTQPTVIVGDGAGVVDAAAAGLIDGSETVLAAAALTPRQLTDALGQAGAVVITDENRKRAHEWRGSQDVLGMTEGPGPATLRSDDGDHRLAVFPSESPAAQSLAAQVGDVEAIASDYGAPSVYRPEDRAANAIDGDPTTAWRVGRGFDPRGELLLLTLASPGPVHTLVLRQPAGNRWITRVTVTAGTGVQTVELTADSRESGQAIDLGGADTAFVTVRIDATESTAGSAVADGVGFAEASLDGLRARESVVMPTLLDHLGAAIPAATPVSVVLTRQRADRPDRDRTDPETRIVRTFTLPASGVFDLTVKARAAGATPREVDNGCTETALVVDGRGVPLHMTGTAGPGGTIQVGPCGDEGSAAIGRGQIELAAGPHTLATASTADTTAAGFTIDAVVLQSGTRVTPVAVPVMIVHDQRTHRTATVGPCPQGCWFVLGDGLNEGWRATAAGHSLGPPTFIDAGMNGWWLPPSPTAVTVDAVWRPQRFTNLGLLVTALTTVVCLLLVALPRRHRRTLRRRTPSRPIMKRSTAPDHPPFLDSGGGRGASGPVIAAGALVLFVVASPVYALVGVVVWAGLRWRRHGARLGVGAGLLTAMVGLFYVRRVLASSPPPNFDWVVPFQFAHRPVLLAVVLLAVAVTGDPPATEIGDVEDGVDQPA